MSATLSWGLGSFSLALGALSGITGTVVGTIIPTLTTPTISSGANTITIPTGAKGIIFIPTPGNTQTLQFKGVTGDTGVCMPKNDPFPYPFDTARLPANVCITAGADVGVCTVIIY